ncbi:MAG: PEP-CTERM sorting domain-containing protein [Desulfobacterales bacterium]|nr:PEP-CTERM sorting domain-containing protein [Desulfobacterales bacterium]
MKRKHYSVLKGLGVTSIFVFMLFSISWAIPLSYLDSVSEDRYEYAYIDSYSTINFSSVKSLQVLPAFNEDGTYYSEIDNGIVGNIDENTGEGIITFITPGPYFVMATYLDDSTNVFAYGVEFIMRNGETPVTYEWHKIETPKPNIVITDPNPYAVKNPNPPPATINETLPPSNPDFPAGTTEVNDKQKWNDVVTYMKTLTNAHVELGGHGSSGKFYWDGQEVLNTTNASKVLNELKGHVNYLTFMSCLTGSDMNFLQEVANTLGRASGYTDCVGGNGTDWFINDKGTLKTAVPEPSTLIIFAFGLVGLASFMKNQKRKTILN